MRIPGGTVWRALNVKELILNGKPQELFTCIATAASVAFPFLLGKCAIIQYRFGLAVAATGAHDASRGAKDVERFNWESPSICISKQLPSIAANIDIIHGTVGCRRAFEVVDFAKRVHNKHNVKN